MKMQNTGEVMMSKIQNMFFFFFFFKMLQNMLSEGARQCACSPSLT